MEFSNIEVSPSTPPPPLPRRRLNYEPPVPYQQRSTNSNAIPPSPGRPGRPIQQPGPRAGINTAFPTTSCFVDHLQRMALMVVGPEPKQTPAMSANYSSMQTSDYSTSISPSQPGSPAFQNLPALESKTSKECFQLTIQVYLRSPGSAFNKEHAISKVDTWCKQLQCSMAFRHLRNKLRDQCGHLGYCTLRVEVFEALPTLEKIISHSLNEREYRGLQECHDHIKRFMQYAKKKLRTTPGFVMPEHVNAIGVAQAANLKFIKEQMEDIRNGDGGERRKRRVALKEQLAPGFDDGRGPERRQNTHATRSDSSLHRIQAPVGQSRPAPRSPRSSPTSSNISPGATVSPSTVPSMEQACSPHQRLKSSPTEGQHPKVTEQKHTVSSTSLDPRLRQRAAKQQNQQPPSPRQSEPPHRAMDSQCVLVPPTPMALPPFPSVSSPGCLAKSHESVLPPILPKSIYRGVAQPYHNMVLVIDNSLWATSAGLRVLKFGYEPDWANGENIQRSGACLERVTLSKAVGKRWLGDALVECFVGDGSGEAPEWVKEWGADVDGDMLGHGWPGSEGGTDEDFGIKSGTRPGDISEETARELKRLQHLSGRHVDFMDWE
ncbi:hypothetical protein EPUS_02150 [Endocarpon pusillum Z07020]|uniref:Uncharacterized protein n=1 Tax=Endocarpon pusillum (strain Z07020 / HMAS-L-300199) TaxID=1263415 RepID=U1GJE1_ENDPU|nr:uncharacterized protein EPUS_02150 [Endocarpon pusillum Z07020]ERF72263.1 hypothetical protein EPUS_02150 [Endocarpon pusillum Z07020]